VRPALRGLSPAGLSLPARVALAETAGAVWREGLGGRDGDGRQDRKKLGDGAALIRNGVLTWALSG
jgi:hypothetical protein